MPAVSLAQAFRQRSACGALLLLALFGAALGEGEGDYDDKTQDHVSAALSSAVYGIMIDGGSSGSRLHMYKIGGGDVSLLPPKDEDEDLFKIEPGLSDHPDGPASLQGMLDAAKRTIPEEDHKRTVLWVKATAGMRMMKRTVLEVMFERLDDYLRKNCPFQYINSEVLGGEQEAVFAYMSINHLKGTINDKPEDRVGILDMGGASMQIAHKPEKFVLDESFSFYVGGERRTVYATSEIKFGINSALQRAFDLVASDSGDPKATSIEFPCYNKGIEAVESLGRKMTIVGTGDSAACRNITHRLLHTEYECLMPPCAFMGMHMDPFSKGTRFYGISNFFYIPIGLGLIEWNDETALTPRQIRTAADKLCNMPGEEAKNTETKGTPWKYRIHHCFGGHYLADVLEAYGFGLDDDNVVFLRKFNGQVVDWSLGAMLYETQAMPLFLPKSDGNCESMESKFEVPAADGSFLAGNQGGVAPESPAPSGGDGGGNYAAFVGAFASVSLVQLVWLLASRALQRRPSDEVHMPFFDAASE